MNIIELHRIVFNLMEEIRFEIGQKDLSFTYGLRQNTTKTGTGIIRSHENGYFFTGDENYISINLSNEGSGNLTTNTVHISVELNQTGHLVIAYINNNPKKEVYESIAQILKISNQIQKNDTKTSYVLPFDNLEELKTILISNYENIIELLNDNNLGFELNKFQKSIKGLTNCGRAKENKDRVGYYIAVDKPANTKTPNNGQDGQDGKEDGDNKKGMNTSLNLILYGPPGTGKTYNTVNRALEIILNKDEKRNLKKEAEDAAAKVDTRNAIIDVFEKQSAKEKAKRKVFTDKFNELKNEGRIEFITFHQSMSYEDFVEGIKPIPTTKGKNVIYNVMPGIFKQICEKAQTNNGNNYVLIIDEINRGNVSQIFGELITLIENDKRLDKPEALTAKLPYSHVDFGVPKNLYIIGTMNTADRSVEALDTALRRRFSFEEIMPKYDATGMDREICGKKLCDILWTINQRIEVLKGREQQIGHSYLMKCKDDKDLKNAFKDKIVPLLQEYFYGDYSQIGLVLGGGFVTKTKSSDIIFPEDFESPNLNEVYHLLTDKEWEKLKMVETLQKMLIHPWPNPVAENTNLAGDPQIEQEETKTDVSQEGTSENLS